MQINPEALKALRERTGYTIRGLATESGVSKSTIAAAEKGERNPSPSAVLSLATALKVPVSALIDNLEPVS